MALGDNLMEISAKYGRYGFAISVLNTILLLIILFT